jgi:hypothetical protein
MAYKFEIIGQALVVTDTNTNEILLDAPKKDLYYFSEYLIKDIVHIYDTSIVNRYNTNLLQIELPLAVDVNLVSFTKQTFENFARLNLGFSTASGGSGAITLAPIGSVVINESITQGTILNEEYAVSGLISDNPVTINWNGFLFPTTAFVSYRALRDGFINITIENKGNITLNINQTIIINN